MFLRGYQLSLRSWSIPSDVLRSHERSGLLRRVRRRLHRRSRHQKALNSPTRRSSGLRRKASGSPMRFMRDMLCSRSVFPGPTRIRQNSYSPQRWPRSHLRSHPIGRICLRAWWQMESCRTPSLKASFMLARRIRNFSRAPGRSMRARLVGARHGAPSRYAAVQIPPGDTGPACGRRPVYDLRYAAHRRARRKAFTRAADRRMVGPGLRWRHHL